MNTALAILAHALRMLIFETAATLRVIMPAVVLVIGCSIGVALLSPDLVAFMQDTQDTGKTLRPDDLLNMVFFGLVGLLGYALMAVLWHRHVLLNGAEQRENLRPNLSIFLGYVWRAVVVGCAQVLAAIPISLAMGGLGLLLIRDNPDGMATMLIGFLGGLAFIWIALRLSLALPAAAIGYTMTLGESWQITKPLSAQLWGVGLLLSGLNVCVYIVTNAVLPDVGIIAVIAQTLVFILEGLVFISVLTTLYGYMVEGRSLGQ
ncbi:hypothetical protein OS190_07110 [Sulfitobacter sp. F26204]|uniref:hypothetical protein n=1 Tax=Sulfitobacter sp. F26204 TaxID=2996014 RepID=UPI00225E44AD|nr:hypothetical protein [Sulfitobacter sp. F26204]MCX7559335.1 hypothetical protein [Sulfitobacter sp. F26204]